MNPIKMIKRQMYGRANFDLLRKRILVDTDFSLSVWLFYDTDLNVTRYDEDGTTAKVRQEFLAILNAANYPTEWLPVIAFSIDSRENVERNYFYRFDRPLCLPLHRDSSAEPGLADHEKWANPESWPRLTRRRASFCEPAAGRSGLAARGRWSPMLLA